MASINVTCRCGNTFTVEEPTAESNFMVVCPACGAQLRIKPAGMSRKEFKRATAPSSAHQVAARVQKCELISGVLWLVIGIVQLVFVWTAAAGVWNIFFSIMRLRSVKNIYVGNPEIVPWYEGRQNWLIAFAVVNLVLGGVVGIFLVAFDWWVRDYVLKNKAAFEGVPS